MMSASVAATAAAVVVAAAGVCVSVKLAARSITLA